MSGEWLDMANMDAPKSIGKTRVSIVPKNEPHPLKFR